MSFEAEGFFPSLKFLFDNLYKLFQIRRKSRGGRKYKRREKGRKGGKYHFIAIKFSNLKIGFEEK